MINVRNFSESKDLTKPKRQLKYMLIWCAEGSVTLVIDENEFELKRNQLITITSGQIHCVKKQNNADGLILEFALDFFCKDDNDIELIFHNGLFCHFSMNEVTTIKADSKIKDYLKLIQDELRKKPYQYLVSLHAYIKLILIEINRSKVKMGGEIYMPDALFLKFLEQVRNNFTYNYPVSHFAKVLRTTVLKLNELSKRHTGKTAQNVICSLIISEAKRLFTYEKLSVKDTAYQLGFKDPYYFSNFFKKHTQMSPKLYRHNILKSDST